VEDLAVVVIAAQTRHERVGVGDWVADFAERDLLGKWIAAERVGHPHVLSGAVRQ